MEITFTLTVAAGWYAVAREYLPRQILPLKKYTTAKKSQQFHISIIFRNAKRRETANINLRQRSQIKSSEFKLYNVLDAPFKYASLDAIILISSHVVALNSRAQESLRNCQKITC